MPLIGIVGGGPCGTYLAYALSRAGHDVTLYDKEEDIGGCWGVYPDKDTRAFTEHAPRVMFDNYVNTTQFFTEIGIDFDDTFKKVYNVFVKMIGSLHEFTLWDLIALTIAYAYPSVAWNGHTVKSVCDTYGMSRKAREYIDQTCYAMDGVSYDTLSAMEYFETLDTIIVSTMYESKTTTADAMLPKLKHALRNVHIHTEHTFESYDPYTKTATFVIPSGIRKNIVHDVLIVCIPPDQLARLYPSLRNKANRMSYTGIGVQFHYKDDIEMQYPDTETIGPWRIIMTYNTHVKCISCVILNIPRVSDATDKKAIIASTWKQLRHALPKLPMYTHATVSPSVYKKNDEWRCHHSAYYRNADNETIHVNKIPGIAYVGSHNPRQFPFTSYESAIETAKHFINASGLAPKTRVYTPWRLKRILFFLIVCLIIYTR